MTLQGIGDVSNIQLLWSDHEVQLECYTVIFTVAADCGYLASKAKF